MKSTSTALILLSTCGGYVFPDNGPFRPKHVVSKGSSYIYIYKGKGKVFPLQARCGPEGGQRYSSTLPRPRHQKGVSGQQHAPAALYPRERLGTHCTGGWVGPRAGLEGRKISSPPGFDPGPSSPQSVAIPTELPGPQIFTYLSKFCLCLYL